MRADPQYRYEELASFIKTLVDDGTLPPGSRFYDLDGPVVRITTPHIPLPAADNLEDIVLPTPERIVDKIKRSMG